MENHEQVERELLEQCDQVECFAWLQRCDECIERLEELCRAKRPRLAVGHRQSAVARIARLAGAKLQLERRFVHVGGEYASRDERYLVWRRTVLKSINALSCKCMKGFRSETLRTKSILRQTRLLAGLYHKEERRHSRRFVSQTG
ncbi:hypothetical protein G5I_08605 [Acromyrmex echinatior]|uniref:Uncharacterized protein n=1 Tax=Acromyrmex echinatior TaxID=103372 RepID=F4WRZ8_ACREC|nr:hypothetical protein G5I_08605 [Acromyrmex echinatior]